jgi:hypothetical protein
MKNINIGVVNLLISNKLKDSYFSKTLNEESKKLTSKFFDVVKNSPILQLEFKIYNNIENKHIDNDMMATRYIDNNIKQFEIYTIDEIDNEHAKLNSFINENTTSIDEEKVELYNAINCLIRESLNDYDKVDVDKIHESFTVVLNHIKSPKKNLVELVETVEHVDEAVIEIAIDKFNEKYEGLNEDDKTLLLQLIKSTKKQKESMLKDYKTNNIMLLENAKANANIESINKAINKINEMKYNPETVDDDIISLHELKKGLI